MYGALKHSHMLFAVISFLFFVLRGGWMLLESPQLQKRWVKVLPHIIDTLLLVCAVSLVVVVQQYPFVHHWVTAKIVGLVLYIVLGTIAIKRGKTKSIRLLAFVGAILVYGYIVGVALRHSPLSFLA